MTEKKQIAAGDSLFYPFICDGCPEWDSRCNSVLLKGETYSECSIYIAKMTGSDLTLESLDEEDSSLQMTLF